MRYSAPILSCIRFAENNKDCIIIIYPKGDNDMSSDLFNPVIKKQLKEDPSKVSRIIFNKEIELYFHPSPKLREIVAQGEHPFVKDLPEAVRSLLLSGEPHIIDKALVWKFLTGQIDQKNAFILNNGEIKVLNTNTTLIQGSGDKNGQ